MSVLTGMRVLIVEDEPLIAMTLEDILIDLGCVVVGLASRLNEALDLVRRLEVDAAILDVNIHGEKSFPVASALQQRGARYVFATGYGLQGVGKGFSNVPVLQKPYSQAQIAAALEALANAR
ncbi:response regulator [Croceibacterium ferulae]|uniref:response regulator n=1 Tax=Croceibacterium ferulae TaxID=1854641 RepID=UPI001F4E603E|nr:response regulator [Croceibacterium ferulae]